MANGSLPKYLATARPNPMSNRAAWYLNTAQSYAGIFLWIAFFDQLAGSSAGSGALPMAGLSTCLLALVVAGAIAYLVFYLVPGLLGMRTGLPLYIVGTSTFGTHGGFLVPGIFMGLLQIGWYSVATYYAADFVLKGLGLEQYSKALFAPGDAQGFSIAFVVVTVVWGYLFALLGALGIKYVARMASVFPIVPAIMLIVGAVLAAPHVGNYKPEAPGKLAGLLLIVQMVIGFFATAGAVGADFCSNNRDVRDVHLGGIFGIWVPIIFAGALALVAVAGAHGKDPSLTSLTYGAALPVLSPTLGKIMLILFAIGSVAPACFCSFIIGNSLSTMLGSERTRIPLTLAGATIGIVLAALGVAANLTAFFTLIGASFGPVVGAMIADYLLSGRRWAGPRQGVNWAGYLALVLGFVVGILNHDWIRVLPVWQPAAVYSAIVGFVVYLIAALAGLQPPTVDVPNLRLEAATQEEQPAQA